MVHGEAAVPLSLGTELRVWLFILLDWTLKRFLGFPAVPVVKNSPANAGDVGSIPGSGRSPRGGDGNPLQYSCLENPMDRGAMGHTESDST